MSPPAPYTLSFPSRPFSPASPSPSLPPLISNQPVAWLQKDLLRTGRYTHPLKGFTLDVDLSRLQRLSATANRMISAGVNIPINLDHSDHARDTMGRMAGRFHVAGDTLIGLCGFIGSDAPLLAARNEVSVGIDPDFTDGHGRHWGDAIVHVALTPKPIVAGQESFVQAASRANATSDVLHLTSAPLTQGSPMPHTLTCPDDVFASLQEHIPGLDQAAPDCRLTHIAEYLRSLSAQDALDVGGPDAVKTLSRSEIRQQALSARQALRDQLASVQFQLQSAENRLATLSRGAVQEMSDSLAKDYADLYSAKTDALVATGHITPACRTRLLSLIKPDGRPNLLLLSRPQGADTRLIDALLTALADNTAITPGSRTGIQTLARTDPPTDPSASSIDPTLTQTMVAMANGHAPAQTKMT